MEKMENSICLDSDILVELLRKNDEIAEWIKEKEENNILATTTINLFELNYGAFSSNSPKVNYKDVEDVKNRLKILNLSDTSAEEAGKQKANLEKQGNIIDFRDILIGSIVLKQGFSLKTGNKKHFSRIKGLKLI